MLHNKQEPAAEQLLAREYVFKGRLLTLRIDTVLTADGHQSTREIIEHGDCIGVIPVDAANNVLLVNQYRTPVGKNLLEIPAGGIDEGEDADTAVVREMQEETGFKPGKVTRLGGFYLSPGFSTEYMHLYLAEDLTPSQLHAEDTAGIELVRVPAAAIPALLTSGKIEDGKSLAGLLYWLKFTVDS
ncbi:MAG: NUDIX hydrolase [Dehalococcoidales bacterium]|jgi:ADP-ribose pyrophosphatase